MKFKIWPPDATTVVEKFAWCMLKVFVPAVYLFFGQFSVWGIWNNVLSKNAAAAQPFWNIIGFILFIVTAGWVYGIFTDKNYVTKSETGNNIIALVGMALSLLASCGFVLNG